MNYYAANVDKDER